MIKIKSKLICLLTLPIFVFSKSSAQNTIQQSINSCAEKIGNEDVSLNFTLGDLIVINQIDSGGNKLSAGFTAGATITTVGLFQADLRKLDLSVFPNPSTDLLNIQINQSNSEYLNLSITDLQGKEIYKEKYAGIFNRIVINISSYPSGIYLISLTDNNNQKLSTYKITKQ